MEQLLGEMAGLALFVAQLKGKDLSRFEEEEFQRMAATLRLRDGRVHTENLTLDYGHSTAQLHGSIGLLDGSLDLGGKLILREEVDAALTGQAQGDEKVIHIEGITGTIDKPRVRIDTGSVAAVLSTYSESSGLKKKLEEEIGKEGAEAIEGILEQILRGGR